MTLHIWACLVCKVSSSIAHISLQHYVSVSIPVAADCLAALIFAKPKYVMLKIMFGYCRLYCGMQKLYYVLPSGYVSR